MKQKPEILIVDDERTVRAAFRSLLEAEGFSVKAVRNGAEALRGLSDHQPDLVLLDVMMPEEGGVAVCERLREQAPLLPILFLTSVDSDTTRVRAYASGGDDYILKTENKDVLIARIRAALRRTAAQTVQKRDPEVIDLGRVSANLKEFTLSFPDGHTDELTRYQAVVLRVLDNHRGHHVGIDELYSALHGVGYVGDPSTVRYHVYGLRAKLGPAKDLLVTGRCSGYKLI